MAYKCLLHNNAMLKGHIKIQSIVKQELSEDVKYVYYLIHKNLL